MINFILGLLIGGVLGIVILACCIIAGQKKQCRKCTKDYCDDCKHWNWSDENEGD